MQKKINEYCLYFNKIIKPKELSFWPILIILTLILFYQNSWVPGFFHDGHLYASFGKSIEEAWGYGSIWLPSISPDMPNIHPHHPPLVFILEGFFFKIFGSSWQSIRIFFGLFIFMSIYFLHIMFKKEKQKSWEIVAIIFFILLPPLFKKTRSPNLDIPLMTFILGALSFYFISFKEYSQKISWYVVGIFFGLALLTKGFPALIIPLTIFVHLILTKKIFITLRQITPWMALIMGLFIGAIWPLTLYFNNQYPFFENYINGQFFGTIIEGRGREELRLWTYPYYLLENAGPWFILSLVSLYQIIKKRSANDLVLLFLSLYITVLVPFSLVRWKYSNYIVPLFPAMSALAALPLVSFFEKKMSLFYNLLKNIILVLALVLLIFPITNKSRRDIELFSVVESIETLNLDGKTKKWILFEETYPYHNLLNFLSFHRLGELSTIKSLSEINSHLASGLSAFLFLPLHLYEANKQLFNHCDKVAIFPNKNIIVIYYTNISPS